MWGASEGQSGIKCQMLMGGRMVGTDLVGVQVTSSTELPSNS